MVLFFDSVTSAKVREVIFIIGKEVKIEGIWICGITTWWPRRSMHKILLFWWDYQKKLSDSKFTSRDITLKERFILKFYLLFLLNTSSIFNRWNGKKSHHTRPVLTNEMRFSFFIWTIFFHPNSYRYYVRVILTFVFDGILKMTPYFRFWPPHYYRFIMNSSWTYTLGWTRKGIFVADSICSLEGLSFDKVRHCSSRTVAMDNLLCQIVCCTYKRPCNVAEKFALW